MAKFRRYDIKKLLGNPDLRRHLIVEGTIATQAREGIEVTRDQAENSYYIVTEGERAAFFALFPFRSQAGEDDERHITFTEALKNRPSPVRIDVALGDFANIDGAPLAYDRLALIGWLFRDNPRIEPGFAIVRQGKATGGDDQWVRKHWEVTSSSWVPFAKGGDFSRFYSDVYLRLDWNPNRRAALKASGNGLPSEDLYFRAGLTWPRRTQRGFSVRRLPAGCVFADKGPAIFGRDEEQDWFLLAILNSRLVEYILGTMISFGSWEVGAVKKVPVPQNRSIDAHVLSKCAQWLHDTKANWDTGNEICTQFDRPWVIQSDVVNEAHSLATALDRVLDREVALQAELDTAYVELNDAVYRLYGVSAGQRSKINEAIGERPPELVWPQMEGRGRDQKRREHVDRLLSYLVKKIVAEDNDGIVCLQRVAHEPAFIDRLRDKLAACFPEQDRSSLETEVVNELKKKTKGYHRAESLAEWLHDVFFETHNALYQQRPLLWHLASSQTRTEPGFACIVHAHRFDHNALAKLLSVHIRDRISTLRREAAHAGQDGKDSERIDLLTLAEEVEAYEARLKLLQEGAQTGPEGGEHDYRIITPWKNPDELPQGWNPDIDDGIKVNLAPLARTGLLRIKLRLGGSDMDE